MRQRILPVWALLTVTLTMAAFARLERRRGGRGGAQCVIVSREMTGFERVTEELGPLIGVERDLHSVHYALKMAARQLAPPVVGALQVHCSDEAEGESIETFQSSFAQDLLPRLKFASRVPFSTSNLGGRYEWGSLAVAEEHFATPLSRNAFKLMVVKINAHVGVWSTATGRRFGQLRRYDVESTCCGALSALIEGTVGPSVDQLRELFTSEGVDRLEMLRQQVEPDKRLLAAAIANARLQARSAVLEAQGHTPRTPTLYLVVPSVTLNKPDRDNEFVCGVYLIDRLGECPNGTYLGLGDQPEAYEMLEENGRLRVRDAGSGMARPVRDHRRIIRDAWLERRPGEPARDSRVDEILARAPKEPAGDHVLDAVLLKSLLLVLSEFSPASAALLLFGEGAAGIYYAYRAHRIAREVEASETARRMLGELHQQVDRMPPDEVSKVLRVLLAEYDRQGHNDGPDGQVG